MEKELASKIFMIDDYENKNEMEEKIKEFMKELKKEYPNATITKEFYKGVNILVRATEFFFSKDLSSKKCEKELYKVDDWYIRQRGER